MRIAIVRGKYLNRYEMQYYEPLVKKHCLTGFASLKPIHDQFVFPVVKLPSPMDLPDFPFKMPILNRLWVDSQWLLGLEKHLKGFDIAHCAETYLHFTQQCLNAKKRGWVKKVVATVSVNIRFHNEGIWGRKRFKQRAIEAVDHFLAISEQAKETLILEGCRPEKITVVTHHIDTAVFRPRLKIHQLKTCLRRQGSRVNELRILFVGRLEWEKGVYETIFALKKLLSEGYPLNLTIIGAGKEKKRLMDWERKLGISHKITHKTVPYDQMPAEYQKADIFIAPSRPTRYWQEQFSEVLLEAQASGLAIVTTNSGAISENVGEAAILVQSADFYSLAQAIKRLILNPKLREELGKKARKRAVEKFDISLGAKKLLSVYESLFQESENSDRQVEDEAILINARSATQSGTQNPDRKVVGFL